MSITASEMTPADIRAVTDGNNGGYGGGWGGGGFRSIDQRLTAQELAAKDQKIADQNQQLFMAQLAASQNAQNLTIKGYVENQFAYYNPRPVPAYQVQNPNCCYGNGYGCGSVA